MNDARQRATPPPNTAWLARGRVVLACDERDLVFAIERLEYAPAMRRQRRHEQTVAALVERYAAREIARGEERRFEFANAGAAISFALELQRAVRAYPEPGLPAGIGIGLDTAPLSAALAASDPAMAAEASGAFASTLARLAGVGQTLFSPDLSPMQRTDAERGRSGMSWMDHGRYHTAASDRDISVFEVGEVDRAPLRPPRGDGVTGWRAPPWWRRPVALVTELVLGLVLVGGIGVLALRTSPATAFVERDWAVMGDLRNLSGDPAFDGAIEEALRIALAESGFVNVVSDRMVNDTLQRMHSPPDAKIGRVLGSEIALRTGSRLVVLPTIANLGGRLRVSVELIDPQSGSTLFARFADSAPGSEVMAAIDTLATDLRATLGETLRGTEAGTALPEVATGSIEALKLYAMGLKAYNGTVPLEALTLFEQAVAVDPEFALAWIGLARSLQRINELDAAKAASERALALRHRLPPSDALYIEAWNLSFGPPGPALEKWRELIERYPDHLAGIYNYAFFRSVLENDFAECSRVTQRLDVPQNPTLSEGLYLHASCLSGEDRLEEARAYFERSLAVGSIGYLVEYADTLAAQRDYAEARSVLARNEESGSERIDLDLERPLLMYAIDQGHWDEGMRLANDLASQTALYVDSSYFEALAWQTSVHLFAQPKGLLARAVADWIEAERQREVPADTRYREQQLFGALAAGYIAMRAGEPDIAAPALALAGPRARTSRYPLHLELLDLMEAERERVEGRPEQAIRLLQPRVTGNELYQTRSALKRAYADAGRWSDAREQAEWLATHRGRAYAERTHRPLLMVLNVVDSNLALLDDAEYSLQLREPARARQRYEQFLTVWPQAESIAWLQPRLERIEDALGGAAD